MALNPTTLVIDYARASDRAALARLAWALHQTNDVALSPAEARGTLAPLVVAGHRLRVGRIGTMPVAYALWRERHETLYVRHFVVSPQHRRLGLGTRFLALLLDHWPAHKDVWLHCQTAPARAFWAAKGFRRTQGAMRLTRPFEAAP